MQEDLDPHFFAQGAASGVKYLYFSFVVITTLGFGDLTPRTDIGRVLVSLEALLGQIFLVTVVAVLVANMGRATRRAPARRSRSGRRPPRRSGRRPERSGRVTASARADAELELGAPGAARS